MAAPRYGSPLKRAVTFYIPLTVMVGTTLFPFYAKVVDTFNDVYAKIHAAVSQRGAGNTLGKSLESFFGSVAEFAPLFVGLRMDPFGMLNRDQLFGSPKYP